MRRIPVDEDEAGQTVRWFLSYVWRRPGQAWSYDNLIVTTHPIEWYVQVKKETPEEEYRIIWYTELNDLPPGAAVLAANALEHEYGEIWPLHES